LAGDRLNRGEVLVASTNNHLFLKKDLTLSYTIHPQNSAHCPSVDVFFESLAKNWPGVGVAVLLTGMGKDGAAGLKLLRSQGWHTIAQDQTTSVVYGMPKAAVQLKAAVEVLSLEQIITALQKLI
jgi:two-component system response regulator WspF